MWCCDIVQLISLAFDYCSEILLFHSQVNFLIYFRSYARGRRFVSLVIHSFYLFINCFCGLHVFVHGTIITALFSMPRVRVHVYCHRTASSFSYIRGSFVCCMYLCAERTDHGVLHGIVIINSLVWPSFDYAHFLHLLSLLCS